MVNKIVVDWSMTAPPMAAKRWYSWAHPSQVPADEDFAITSKLGWEPETLAILRQAFAAKLDRHTGWSVAPDSAIQAFQQAAACFKRGVPWQQGQLNPSPQQQSGSYPIEFADHLEPGSLCGQNEYLVMDENVLRSWPRWQPFAHLQLRISELHKDLASVAKILQGWEAIGSPKDWVIIGGGVLSDTAAFAAHLAAARFHYVPTTLLAMVDACVGGKTGVNFPPYGKNQLGAFAFPHKVTIDPAWLTTLESRDILAGGAECLKHAILAGKPDLMTGLTTALQQQNLTTLAAYLPTMVQIKADIVAKDPTEQGIRATLNLGHTLAHALEAVSHGSGNPPDQTIHHGEAVALGLYFATILSERAGYLAKDKSSFITQHLLQSGTIIGKAQLARYLGSQTLSQDDIWPRIAAHFAHDKKHKSNQTASQWILLQDFGTVQRDEDGSYTVGVDAEILKLSWDQFLSEIF